MKKKWKRMIALSLCVLMILIKPSITVPAETIGQTEETGKTEETSQTEETGKTEETSQTEETGKTEETSQAEETSKTEETSQQEETNRTEEISQSEETGQIEETGGEVKIGQSDEGKPDKDVFRVVLPTNTSHVFDFIMDPQQLISKTDAAAYGGSVFEEGATLFFKRSDGESEEEYSSCSDMLHIINAGTAAVNVSLTAYVSPASIEGIAMTDDPDFIDEEYPSLYLALMDGEETVPINSVYGASIDTWIEGAEDGEYNIYSFQLTGAVNPNGDWSEFINVEPEVIVTWKVTMDEEEMTKEEITKKETLQNSKETESNETLPESESTKENETLQETVSTESTEEVDNTTGSEESSENGTLAEEGKTENTESLPDNESSEEESPVESENSESGEEVSKEETSEEEVSEEDTSGEEMSEEGTNTEQDFPKAASAWKTAGLI